MGLLRNPSPELKNSGGLISAIYLVSFLSEGYCLPCFISIINKKPCAAPKGSLRSAGLRGPTQVRRDEYALLVSTRPGLKRPHCVGKTNP